MGKLKTECFIEPLPFDTKIFGIKCGALVIKKGFLSSHTLEMILKEAKEQKYGHLVSKIPAENVALCNLLEDFNFKFKICSLRLEKIIDNKNAQIEGVIPFHHKYTKQLVKLTEDAFLCGTRFHYEKKFDPLRVKIFYRSWIINLIKDINTNIYIYLSDGRVMGYITVTPLSNYSRQGRIGLFAVARKCQGRGIGTKLIKALEFDMHEKLSKLSVVTESINYKALKVYFQNGFRANQSWNVFHLAL